MSSITQYKKTDFTPFPIGTVFNSLKLDRKVVKRVAKSVVLKYPSRLEAMAIDPSKIAKNENLRYTPGQIDFTTTLFRTFTVKVTNNKDEIQVSERSDRKVLIRHAVCLMKKALGISDGLYIDVEDKINLRHCGLGSSSGLIAGVANAINEIYGNPVTPSQMVKYLAQNHGEEIDGDENNINPVQCIGGSAACGTFGGGVVIIAGENTVVKTANINKDYKIVIGIPKNFKYPDSKYLMDKEIENLPKFMACGKKYGPKIAYKMFHDCLPALENGNIKPLGDLIFDYRWNMGSIDNCSFVYPPINKIAKDIVFLKLDGYADVLALSSVGPGFFAITKDPKVCEKAFKKEGMNTYKTTIHNGKYMVIEKR